MILQLNPAIPVTTPKGNGIAHFLVDYGQESDLYWIVFIDETGESWMYSNKEIRAQKNVTLGRSYEFKMPKEPSKFKPIKELNPWVKEDKQSPKKTFDGFHFEPIKNAYCNIGQNEFSKPCNYADFMTKPYSVSYNIDGR